MIPCHAFPEWLDVLLHIHKLHPLIVHRESITIQGALGRPRTIPLHRQIRARRGITRGDFPNDLCGGWRNEHGLADAPLLGPECHRARFHLQLGTSMRDGGGQPLSINAHQGINCDKPPSGGMSPGGIAGETRQHRE